MPGIGIPRLIHTEKDRVYQLIIELAKALVTAQPDDVLEYSLKYLRGQVASKKTPRVLIYSDHSATAEELAPLVAVRSGLLHLTREYLRSLLQNEENNTHKCSCDKCDTVIIRCAAATLKKAIFQTTGYVTAGLPWDGAEVDVLESELVIFTHFVHVTGTPREPQKKLPLCPRHLPMPSDYQKRLKSLLKHFESKVILTIPAGNETLDALAAECEKQIFADTLISPNYRVKWKPRVVIFGAELTRPEWFAERLCEQYGLVYVDMEALVLYLPPERRACANRVELVEARVREWDCVMAGWVLVGGPKDAEEMSRLDSSCCKPNRVFMMKADIDWLLFRVDGGRFFRKHEGTTYKTYYGEAKSRPAIFQETFGYLDRLKGMQQYCGASAVALDCQKALQERYKDMVLQLQLGPPVAPMRSGSAPLPSDVGLGDYASKLDDYAPTRAPQLHDAPSTDAVVFSSTEVLIINSDQIEEALKESPEPLQPHPPCAKSYPTLDDSIRALVAELKEDYGESGKLFKRALKKKLIPQLSMLMDKLRLSGAGPELLPLFPQEARMWTTRAPICEELATPELEPGGQWIPRDLRPRRFSVEVLPPSPRKAASGTGEEVEGGGAPKLATPRYQPRAEGTQERREKAERLKQQRMPLETSGFPLTTLKTRLRRMGREYVPDKAQPPARSRHVRAEQEFWYLSSPYYVSNKNVLFSVYNKVVGGTDYISDALARQIAPLGPLGQPCLSMLTRCVVSGSPSEGSETAAAVEEEVQEDETASKGELNPCDECVITYERERQRPLDEEHYAPYKLPKYIDQRTQDIVAQVGQHQKPVIPNSEAFYPALTGEEPVISTRLPMRDLQTPTAPNLPSIMPVVPADVPLLASTYRRFVNEPGYSIHYVAPPEGICTARCLPRDDSHKIRPDIIEDALKNLPTELAPRKLELDIKRVDIARYEISKQNVIPESPLVRNSE